MFYELRKLAANTPGIREVLVRSYRGGSSLDQYYLLRGCQLVSRPARLVIPRMVHALFRWSIPGDTIFCVGLIRAAELTRAKHAKVSRMSRCLCGRLCGRERGRFHGKCAKGRRANRRAFHQLAYGSASRVRLRKEISAEQLPWIWRAMRPSRAMVLSSSV